MSTPFNRLLPVHLRRVPTTEQKGKQKARTCSWWFIKCGAAVDPCLSLGLYISIKLCVGKLSCDRFDPTSMSTVTTCP